MAMRPPSRIGGTTPRRTQPITLLQPAVFEDFRPVTEWQLDEESNSILLIYLPGFQREHLKVSTEGRNILRAKGERLISGNRWSRFQEDYTLPEDCNVRGIRAKFEGGILAITIPRKRDEKDASNEATTATRTTPKPSPKAEDTPKPSQKTEEPISSRMKPSPPERVPEVSHQKAADDSGRADALPSVSAFGKRRFEITQETPLDQKMSSDQKPKKSLIEKPEKPKEESAFQKIPQRVEKLADRSEDAIKKTMEESKAQKDKDKGDSSVHKELMPPKADKPEKSGEENHDRVPDITRKTAEKSEQERGYQTIAGEIKNVHDKTEDSLKEKSVKPKLPKNKGDQIELKERKTKRATAPSTSTDYRPASYKPTFKKFLDSNEERRLLVNVGGAVLVIAAFGAYLSYTFQEKLQ